MREVGNNGLAKNFEVLSLKARTICAIRIPHVGLWLSGEVFCRRKGRMRGITDRTSSAAHLFAYLLAALPL